MPTAEPHVHTVRPTGDFAPNAPLLRLSLFALAIGAISTLGARVLLAAISLFTNIFHFGELSLSKHSPAPDISAIGQSRCRSPAA